MTLLITEEDIWESRTQSKELLPQSQMKLPNSPRIGLPSTSRTPILTTKERCQKFIPFLNPMFGTDHLQSFIPIWMKNTNLCSHVSLILLLTAGMLTSLLHALKHMKITLYMNRDCSKPQTHTLTRTSISTSTSIMLSLPP